MIEETAIVVAHEPGIAWVETRRRNACGACSQSAGCGSALLSRLFAPGANRLALEDGLGVAIGERVVIGIPDDLLVRAALIAYLLPLLTLVMGAVLADGWQLAEIEVALASIAGLGAGLWLTGHLTGGARGRQRYRPILLRREPATPTSHRASGTAPRAQHPPQQPNPEVSR
ncbi:MAG: SoxR reducing system RseC family protein [Chromatiaceae bacterium]|nr:SoxR reducing system RseC family protein [Chromatiaceae bacterium]